MQRVLEQNQLMVQLLTIWRMQIKVLLQRHKVIGDRAYYVSFTEDTTEIQSVHGITPNLASRITGVGTVAIVTEVDGEQTVVYIDDVFYIPRAEFELFSPGLARDQGFEFAVDPATMNFHISIEGRTVIVATQHDAMWCFRVTHPSIPGNLNIGPECRAVCNYTVAEGVAPLSLWHERLGHTCPQYLKTMVDKGLVRGMMLTQRQLDTCDACHLAKQKKSKHRKKLDRALKRPNQVVYADLLIPTVLLIMDGYSRYVTVKLLTSKSSTKVNQHLKQYVLWAERQAGRSMGEISFEVNQALTDKGGEFVNTAMADWYAPQGIEHVRVGPKSSQLNLCERTHQSLVEMTKATMLQAGFPVSLWPEALRNAAYVKNRVYNKGTQGIPYEKMFGIKPDVHHIRKFGALAYVHVPVTPGRRKHHHNAKIGYALGYAEDVVGCKVYYPDERTAKFVTDLRVAEDVVYRDRHDAELDEDDLSSLHFTKPVPDNDACKSSMAIVEINSTMPSGLEEGEDVVDESEIMDTIELNSLYDAEDVDDNVEGITDVVNDADVDTGRVRRDHGACEEVEHTESQETASTGHEEPVADGEDAEEDHEGDDQDLSNEEITIASVFASEDDEDRNSSNILNLEEDMDNEKEESKSSTLSIQHGNDREVIDASAVLTDNQLKQTGKRAHRDETQSEEERVEQEAAKAKPKKTRRGLLEASERRRPVYLKDYVFNAVQATSRVLDRNRKPIRGSDAKIPRNRCEMLRSKWKEFFLMAEMEEMAALKAKGVIREIASEEVPNEALPIKTMWVSAAKTDHQGFVIRFKARIVALGNYERSGVDFRETFAPVARMSTFRLLLALAAKLGRDWNSELNQWLREHGYQQSLTEPCLYYRFDGDTIMYVLVYVDDIFVATNNEQCKKNLFEDLDRAYGIKDQEQLKEYLGIEVDQTAEHIMIRQSKYAREILEKFGYSEVHAVGNPMEVNARLAPTNDEEEVNTEFPYREAIGMLIDWATDPEERKITTGFVYELSGGAIAWMSCRQSVIALSTAESEYVAACEATMEALAMRNILQEILPYNSIKLQLGIDNQTARRTRHIELRWHYVREQVERGAIKLHKVKREDNTADSFTKPLEKKRLKRLLQGIGVGAAD
uniref:Integrase catalytic domain-containing protein n=1 Tax=Phytophthora ramorum TaxID=164328 RepID=H3GV56_PHYRM